MKTLILKSNIFVLAQHLKLMVKMFHYPTLAFTEKHKHHFELDLNAELPHYKNANKDEKDWDPETWLLKTCGNNKTQANFLLQIMGVMLVPNHAFNMFIEINGKSNSGKTTLLNIVKSIYSGQKDNDLRIKLNYTLNDLNDTFPFRVVLIMTPLWFTLQKPTHHD